MLRYRVQPSDRDKVLVYDDGDNNDVASIAEVVNELVSLFDLYDLSIQFTGVSRFEGTKHEQTVFIVSMDTDQLFTVIQDHLEDPTKRCAAFVRYENDGTEEFNKLKRKINKNKAKNETAIVAKSSKNTSNNNNNDVNSGALHLYSVENLKDFPSWLPIMLKFLFGDTIKETATIAQLGVLFLCKMNMGTPKRWSHEMTRVLENMFQVKAMFQMIDQMGDSRQYDLVGSAQLLCLFVDAGHTTGDGNKVDFELNQEDNELVNRAQQLGSSVLVYVPAAGVELHPMTSSLDLAGFGRMSHLTEMLRILGLISLKRKKDPYIYSKHLDNNYRTEYNGKNKQARKTEHRHDNGSCSNDVCLVFQAPRRHYVTAVKPADVRCYQCNLCTVS